MPSFVGAAAAQLGSIAFDGTASLAFDATGCDLIAFCVAWADTSGDLPPYVTYAGAPAQALRAPRLHDGEDGLGIGNSAVYIVRDPPAGTSDFVVKGTSFLGDTQVLALGYAGTSGEIGAVASGRFEGTAAAAFTLPGVAAGSHSVAFVAHRYGANPTMMSAPNWGQRAVSLKSGGGAGIWAFDTNLSGDVAFAPDTTDTSIFAHVLMIEVFAAGHVAAGSPIAVVDAKVDCLGLLDPVTPISSTFDAQGAGFLLVGLAAGNTGQVPPIRLNGARLAMQAAPQQADEDVGTVWWTLLIDPPAGTLTVTLPNQTGFYGPSTVYWLAFDEASGVLRSGDGASAAGFSLAAALPSQTDSLLAAIAVSEFSAPAPGLAVNAEWIRRDAAIGDSATAWLYTARGGPDAAFEAVLSSFANLQVVLLELGPALQGTADVTGAAAVAAPALAGGGTGGPLDSTPDGQKLSVYWESFFDVPAKPDPQPSDFVLAHVPPLFDAIYLSAAAPRCTYAGLGDNVAATTGLSFDYPATLLRDILAGIKARVPHMKFLLNVFQPYSPEGFNEPFNPDGWGGMTEADIAALRQFCDDVGIAGIILDYEVLSQLSGFGIELDGPLVAGNSISVRFTGQYAPASGLAPAGPDPVDYDFTVTRSFAGSSDATLAALAADLTAAMQARDMPQGRAYPDTAEDTVLLRLVYHFTVAGVQLEVSVTGGDAQPGVTTADNSFDYHCRANPAVPGQRHCWTDPEMLRVIDMMRAGFPRPDYELWLDVFGVGLYGEGPYALADPTYEGELHLPGYNHSYNLVLTRPENAATLARLDGVHLMSYDVGDGFDPRVMLRAALHYLPDTPVFIGLRVGPPDYAGIKRSVAEMIDYANHVIVQGAAGAMIYALMWDGFDQRADFTPDHPDINLAAWAVAKRFGKTDLRQRANSRLRSPFDLTVRS